MKSRVSPGDAAHLRMRIPAAAVLAYLRSGYTDRAIREDHPTLRIDRCLSPALVAGAPAGVLRRTRRLPRPERHAELEPDAVDPGREHDPRHQQPSELLRLEATAPGRMGDPAELGRMATVPLSPVASSVTGTALPIDGGQPRSP